MKKFKTCQIEFNFLTTLIFIATFSLSASSNSPKSEKGDNRTISEQSVKFKKGPFYFEGTISREVLENYLDRSITIQSLLIARGNFDDNLRMIKNIGAKVIGRTACQSGGEADLLKNLEQEKGLILKVHQIDPDIIL